MGKLITFEGTDCSGKETQTNMLVDHLIKDGYKVAKFDFPDYSTATGKIIAGPFLGKFGEGYFQEGSPNVPPYVASLYYSADRAYNHNKIVEALEENDFVFIDRYTYSNLAYNGAKFKTIEERNSFFNFMTTLEFDMLGLTRPDMTFFLYMPTEKSVELRQKRAEKADQNEKDIDFLKRTEKVYLDMVNLYNFVKIDCVEDNNIKTIPQIHEEVYKKFKQLI
jgi:dTMP kinase